ncbi:FRG domain-containing protein [Dickeya fangzhongdai]|uniref:FRG domain-containing protein n=1 Tax=Dickeya fangzhongdai TaxID=1778540 RepID=UPI0026E0B241|nr:FRG domain-containing protein [Dickeya fangzhongdai]WKV51519.1 FRG domain-containing protein [Dickeya fangzhongdai]
MYNLLVTAREGAWDEEFYEFDRSRFLEYTTESIAAIFQSLTPDLIETLKGYPCLFAYEGDTDDLRIGKLNSIKERGRKIFIEFELDDRVPPIPFERIKPLATLLDFRNWEMNRTHWAVKDEDLFLRLEDAGIINHEHIREPEKSVRLSAKRSNNPKVTTVQGFIAKVLATEKNVGSEVFYRGHSNKSKYKLEPSLFRKDDEGNPLYLESEHLLYKELIVSNSADFQFDNNTLDILVRMQHYSLPTRLLDITSNPLIALYFSCKSALSEDGEVIIFSMKQSDVKYFDSDVASCIANLARLPKKDKDDVNFDHPNFNEQTAIKKLGHFIREEKSYFEMNIQAEDLRKIICVKGKKSNARISSQSGAFILYGLDAVMSEEGTPEIAITRITVENKEQILKELDLLNINESTVFPYIENSAKYIAEKYKFDRKLA